MLAPTAGGKTEAAIFPALAQMIEKEPSAVGVIYVAPIKALLNNQDERLATYAEMVGLRSFVWHGDVPYHAKAEFNKDPAQLLMTTPESLEVMLVSPHFSVRRLFRDLRMVVIDEVHALAGTDRGAHLLSVFERLATFANNDVQRVGLSATVGNPESIVNWLKGSSKREGRVVSPPRQPSKRELQVGLYESSQELAQQASAKAAGKKSLFFCQSRSLTESVAERMRGRGTDVFVHHSSVSLEERRAAENKFHGGANACIVCTSTLELGIDVGDLDLVLQANAPSTVSSFLQRMGRTGRRPGTTANTTFLCEDPEAVVQAVALIELARKGWVEPVPEQKRCWPVLVHQLLALTLQYGAISQERCWGHLSRVPDFGGIEPKEFERLVAHMKQQDYLFESGGLLSMGQKAERVFGKKLPGALRGLQQPGALPRANANRKRHRLAGASLRGPAGGTDVLVSAGRKGLAGGQDQPRSQNHHSGTVAKRKRALLGRLRTAAPGLRAVPAHARRAHGDHEVPVRKRKSHAADREPPGGAGGAADKASGDAGRWGSGQVVDVRGREDQPHD